jgi:hypothetical protein
MYARRLKRSTWDEIRQLIVNPYSGEPISKVTLNRPRLATRSLARTARVLSMRMRLAMPLSMRGAAKLGALHRKPMPSLST